MSKLDKILDDFHVSTFGANDSAIDSLALDTKRRVKDLFIGHLYGLKAMLEDPSMDAKTPPERVDDVIRLVEQL